VLPFATDQFFAVFARYNAAIWPVQLVAAALGIVALVLLLRSGAWTSRAIALILAAFWLLMGIGYHLLFFTRINALAYVFAFLFVTQAGLFLVDGLTRRLTFQLAGGWSGRVAWTLMAYALVVYPLIGLFGPHPYPATPLFGVAPCPTVIFTLALLLLSNARWRLVFIPLLWSAVGGSAAVLLAVPQDYGLILAGALLLILRLAQPAILTVGGQRHA
jgi:hypothetical protein